MLEPQLGMSMKEVVQTAKLAEELGFGYLFRSDHLLPTDDRRGIDSPECWTSLGAIAASTESLKFGPMVSPVGFRNPALLARMACTVHSFSGGRLQLSMGAGWYGAEYRAHGYEFPPLAQRLGEFREAFDIVTALVREGKADFDGKYFSAHTDCLPRPAGDVHLIVGGKVRSLVRFAALRADEWNLFVAQADEYRELRKVFDSASNSRNVQVSETGPFLIGKNRSDLERSAALQVSRLNMNLSPLDLLERIRRRNAPCGTVEEFVDQIRAKVDLGIQKFYLQTFVPENTSMIELLADTLKQGL